MTNIPTDIPKANILTAEQILSEFEIAVNGMDFSQLAIAFNVPDSHADQFKTLLYTYFTAGALWAQDVISPGGIVTIPKLPTELIKH